jgi:hypothetical protein
MRSRLVVASLLALALACGSDNPGQPDPGLAVDLTLNGGQLGAFSCDGGLFFAVDVRNVSQKTIRLQRLAMRFDPTDGSCQQQTAPIDPTLGISLDAGQSTQVRRVDLAGQLCGAPSGSPRCTWTATAEVASEEGSARDQLGFSTYSSSRADCVGVVPRIGRPVDGAVLSGVAEVLATVVEGAGCNMSARTIIRGFSAAGQPVFTSGPLDLAEVYRWDTTRVANGSYWLTAHQNCCQIPSAPTVVTVKN